MLIVKETYFSTTEVQRKPCRKILFLDVVQMTTPKTKNNKDRHNTDSDNKNNDNEDNVE